MRWRQYGNNCTKTYGENFRLSVGNQQLTKSYKSMVLEHERRLKPYRLGHQYNNSICVSRYKKAIFWRDQVITPAWLVNTSRVGTLHGCLPRSSWCLSPWKISISSYPFGVRGDWNLRVLSLLSMLSWDTNIWSNGLHACVCVDDVELSIYQTFLVKPLYMISKMLACSDTRHQSGWFDRIRLSWKMADFFLAIQRSSVQCWWNACIFWYPRS